MRQGAPRAGELVDFFAPVLAVKVRPMFGGHGIYGPEGIFAIDVDGVLFLKVDAETRRHWEQAGSRPFTYEKKAGQQAVMSYFALPDEAYDDPDALRHWVGLARSAAARAEAQGNGKRPARR
ncbi:TfoX/Sxy family protein [Rhabdaerophilum sp. SD176]|uniref:TfoX/Sxy family protein n=1 Tax=Rhabdaerophilum sp. SD176 TaxID=2983548 RepID=UPI0024DF6CBB|nr:TfoX/Sxy family protein [Rhabdaerophilum sp. SD176]